MYASCWRRRHSQRHSKEDRSQSAKAQTVFSAIFDIVTLCDEIASIIQSERPMSDIARRLADGVRRVKHGEL